MDRTVPLFFAGVASAIIVTLVLAAQTGDIFQNPETFVLALAGVITKIWVIFFAFSLIIVFPVIGIDSIKKGSSRYFSSLYHLHWDMQQ